MADVSTWDTSAANNNSAAPDGFPEGMNPSDVNNAAREVMAAVRRQWEEGGFFDYGHTVTNVDLDTFRVDNSHGDVTGTYEVGRRVKITDSSTLYGEISASSYTGGVGTDVDVTLDSGSISASISAVGLGPDTETYDPNAVDLGSTQTITGNKTFSGTVKGPFITSNRIAAHKNLIVTLNSGTPDEQIDIDADDVLLEDSSGNIYKASSVNLTVDTASSGAANQLDTGTIAADTWYYLYVIYNGTTVAGLASTSSTSPTLPSGYTYSGLVGAALTDATSDFISFRQENTIANLDVMAEDLDSATGSTAGTTLTLSAPPDSVAEISLFLASNGSQQALVTETWQTNTDPSTAFDINVTGTKDNTRLFKRVDSSSQVRYRNTTLSSGQIIIFTSGWRWE